MFVAVLDLGKTNSKLALVDTERAEEVELISCPTPVAHDVEPYRHVDINALDVFFRDALRLVARKHTIDAITVAAHGACGVLVDEAGEPVLPVLDYEDPAPDTLEAAYNTVRPDFSETGSPRLPEGLNIGAQLFWQQRTYPSDFARAHAFLTWSQFWVARLCGVMRNDPSSLGAHTDLYRPEDGQPSSLVRAMGWDALFPSLCRSGEVLGSLSGDWVHSTGLDALTPVHAGIHDSNASLVPHLLTRESPCTVISTGTWFIAMAVGAHAGILDESRDTLINVDAFARPVPSARFMGGREHALLVGHESVAYQQADIEQALDIQAWVMPSVVQGTGPWPHAPHRWAGTFESLSAQQREVLVSLYLALMTAESLELLSAEGPSIVEGPLAGNAAYLQMLAAVTGRPVETGSSGSGTSVGIALLVQRYSSKEKIETVTPEQSVVTISKSQKDQLLAYAQCWRAALAQHVSHGVSHGM